MCFIFPGQISLESIGNLRELPGVGDKPVKPGKLTYIFKFQLKKNTSKRTNITILVWKVNSCYLIISSPIVLSHSITAVIATVGKYNADEKCHQIMRVLTTIDSYTSTLIC